MENDQSKLGETIIDLREVQPDTFEVYLHWIYASELDGDFVRKHGTKMNIAKLWLLAELVEDYVLCNMVCDKILHLFDHKGSVDITSMTTICRQANYVWRVSRSDQQGLKLLFADICATAMRSSQIECDDLSSAPSNLTEEFAKVS